MKINWGLGIIILYMGFVAMILLLVGMSASQKIDLVTDHYYDQEVHLQEKINKTKRAHALPEPLTWEVKDDLLVIWYPKSLGHKPVSGQIKLYCPANDKNDRSFAVSSDKLEQRISLAQIPQGNYRLQIDWRNDENTYWTEDVIVVTHLK